MNPLPLVGRTAVRRSAAVLMALLASACESSDVRELAQTTAANTASFNALLKDHQVRRTGVYTLSAVITAEDERSAEEQVRRADLETAVIDNDDERRKVERLREAFRKLRATTTEDVVRRRELEADLLAQLTSAELEAQAIQDLTKSLASLGTDLGVKESLDLYRPFARDVFESVQTSFEQKDSEVRGARE